MSLTKSVPVLWQLKLYLYIHTYVVHLCILYMSLLLRLILLILIDVYWGPVRFNKYLQHNQTSVFTCSARVCVSFLWVLLHPPTIQKHADWDFKLIVIVCVGTGLIQ